MPQVFDEEEIRRRAYAIWEAEGRPQGRAEAHWIAAQVELEARAGIQEFWRDEHAVRNGA